MVSLIAVLTGTLWQHAEKFLAFLRPPARPREEGLPVSEEASLPSIEFEAPDGSPIYVRSAVRDFRDFYHRFIFSTGIELWLALAHDEMAERLHELHEQGQAVDPAFYLTAANYSERLVAVQCGRRVQKPRPHSIVTLPTP